MLFNLFGKKEDGQADRLFADKVYIESEGKMNACLELALSNQPILFITWFSETFHRYRDFFNQNGATEAHIAEARLVDLALLQDLTPVFVEHYPLNARELALVEPWEHKNIPVFSAMDEPLFKHFGSDKMVPLIKLFGMKASQAIEHPYVTESIVKGQKKIADKVVEEIPATSQAEWMEKNLSSAG